MVSKSQIDKLGDRLRKGTPRDGDEELLFAVLQSRRQVLSTVVERLRMIQLADGTSLEPSSRVKTIGTLVEKLQRVGIGLSSVDDLAGARVVVGESRGTQDLVRDRILELFPGAKVNDRRVVPSSGYRAVHVVVSIDEARVEIQVRTTLQHQWAETYERLGDLFGREIRYNQTSSDSEPVVAFMQRLSETIHSHELSELEHLDSEERLAQFKQLLEKQDITAELVVALTELEASHHELRDVHQKIRGTLASAMADIMDLLELP